MATTVKVPTYIRLHVCGCGVKWADSNTHMTGHAGCPPMDFDHMVRTETITSIEWQGPPIDYEAYRKSAKCSPGHESARHNECTEVGCTCTCHERRKS